MKKHIVLILQWVAKKLIRISVILEREKQKSDKQSKYVDLAPTDDADKSGVYAEAIRYATNNPKVFNIALTGPYGSGKSSIIQSFLKKYKKSSLLISLAAFVPEIDSKNKKESNPEVELTKTEVSRHEIERSILQQMLYGADADKLPLSRFKRIQSPSFWAFFKSLYITLGILSLGYVFYYLAEITSGSLFVPFSASKLPQIGAVIFAVIFLWVTLHHFYIASYGLSLKSISLRDVEIKPAKDDEASILNRHLDEIIYFFQSTDYDIVIIEDLDRFENVDIFVTLREINSLINKNGGVKRTIRFLYALRDDIFINTDRTKFFEFIIPVVPIISTSNSIDMVLKQGHRLELNERLNRQFLMEVSRYLNDLRLIQNIFNEYAIYMANLKNEGEHILDDNKLLAVLIYKNVYPKDFELLHRGEGNLARILSCQDEFISSSEAKYRADIAEIEEQLAIAEAQVPSDLKELRQIYAMTLIEALPSDTQSISHNQRTWVSLNDLTNSEAYEQFIKASHFQIRTPHGPRHWADPRSSEELADYGVLYDQRKAEIENKATDLKNKSLRQIRDLRIKITQLRNTQFKELLRLNSKQVLELLENFGKDGKLARYLLLEGYLDDTYYQFTSLFHSGRLSPNDNKFLVHIRAFVTPEPDFQIDTPVEVIAAMRDDDFRRSYVLNVKIVDALLRNQTRYNNHINKLFELLSTEFESCTDFFDAYYTSGENVSQLLAGLAKFWRSFIPHALASTDNLAHVSRLIAYLPEKQLKNLAGRFDELPKFVSENLAAILSVAPDITPERLKSLRFEIEDFYQINDFPEVVRFMFDSERFKLTINNLNYIYESVIGQQELKSLHEKNFTSIRSAKSTPLINKVERSLSYYLKNILLKLKDNTKEDASTILFLLQQDELELDDLREFLDKQTTRLPSLENIPPRFHTMLFELNRIEPNWINCLALLEHSDFNPEILVEFLERDDVRTNILKYPIPSDAESFTLREFIINAESFSNETYKQYVHALPKQFRVLPTELEEDKLRILIDEEKITFSQENLDKLADYRDLQIHFVATNIKTYLDNPQEYEIDDIFREALLRTDIDEQTKLRIVELMDLEQLVNLPERAALIGPLIDASKVNSFNLSEGVVRSLVLHSSPITKQISLLNKYQSSLTNEQVRSILASLPKPFSEISFGHHQPKLKNTPENQDLIKWLDKRNIISSPRFYPHDIKVNLYRRR